LGCCYVVTFVTFTFVVFVTVVVYVVGRYTLLRLRLHFGLHTLFTHVVVTVAFGLLPRYVVTFVRLTLQLLLLVLDLRSGSSYSVTLVGLVVVTLYPICPHFIYVARYVGWLYVWLPRLVTHVCCVVLRLLHTFVTFTVVFYVVAGCRYVYFDVAVALHLHTLRLRLYLHFGLPVGCCLVVVGYVYTRLPRLFTLHLLHLDSRLFCC